METKASVRGVRLSVDKGRLVADLIRGKKVDQAINILTFTPKKAAGIIKKAVESAVANAEHNDGADIDELKITSDLRRAGHDAEAFLRTRQGPRQPHQQAHLPHLRDRRQLREEHGTENPPDRLPPARHAGLVVALVRQQPQLRRHAGRRPEGARVPEGAAEERRRLAHPDRAPGQERPHHDLLGTSGRRDRQEGRGHREPEGRTGPPPGRAGGGEHRGGAQARGRCAADRRLASPSSSRSASCSAAR